MSRFADGMAAQVRLDAERNKARREGREPAEWAAYEAERHAAGASPWTDLAAWLLWLLAIASGIFAVIFFIVAMETKCLGSLCFSGQQAAPDPIGELLTTIILGGLAVGLGFAARSIRRRP